MFFRIVAEGETKIIRLPNLAGTGGFPEVLGGNGRFNYPIFAVPGRRVRGPAAQAATPVVRRRARPSRRRARRGPVG